MKILLSCLMFFIFQFSISSENNIDNNDNRYPIDQLYNTFRKLKTKGWIEEQVAEVTFEQNGKNITLPILSFRTQKKGKTIWILSGIHGEEPAGPNAMADAINYIAELGKTHSVVILPLCNPSGYFRNWRYLNMEKYSKVTPGQSVGDSEYLLLTNDTPRANTPNNPIAFTFTDYILNLAHDYPPYITINLHEDDMLTKGYIYSQGKYGEEDKIAKAVVGILKKNEIPVQLNGRTRFNEIINNGIVGPVEDGSIDELFSAKKIYVNGRHVKGPSAETVIVFETPAKEMSLEKRKKAHYELIKSLKSIIN